MIDRRRYTVHGESERDVRTKLAYIRDRVYAGKDLALAALKPVGMNTPEGWSRADAMAEQGFRCPICEQPFDLMPQRDHDHQTGRYRALLHPSCNQFLGAVEALHRRGLRIPAFAAFHAYLDAHGP